MIDHYINKTVPFKFRGINFTFALSQGLFSSADVDSGTKFLLKILSPILDEDMAATSAVAAGKSPPLRVLDAGCGTGVIGICAAAAINAAAAISAAGAIAPPVNVGGGLRLYVRCQDRDELARQITVLNAAQNGIAPSVLEAYTEPLLAGPGDKPLDANWDLILTNIPAKAGTPVLADFVRRSANMLNPGGKVIMVAVRTLADFFRERIAADAELVREHTGPGHSVFVYTRAANQSQPAIAVNGGPDFVTRHPFYVRAEVTRDIEDIPVHLTTIHGASGFDQPGGAVLAAAKLARKLGAGQFFNNGAPLLVYEPEQGWFPCWFLGFLYHEGGKNFTTEDTEFYGGHGGLMGSVVLSGRNILALEAARHNVIQNVIHNVRQNVIQSDDTAAAAVVPAADLALGETALRKAAGGQLYGCIAAFPELLPQSSLPQGVDQLGAIWDAVPPLLADGGLFLAAFSSSDAERFDRKKLAGFSRLGSVKRNGFRALAYRRTNNQ